MYRRSRDLWLAFVVCFLFFVKQKTAYEMRISDWRSDVCSADLIAGIHQMKPILRGLDSVGTREGEASSAVLIWIAPTLLEPDFAANRQDSRTMKPTSDKGRPANALANTAMSKIGRAHV